MNLFRGISSQQLVHSHQYDPCKKKVTGNLRADFKSKQGVLSRIHRDIRTFFPIVDDNYFIQSTLINTCQITYLRIHPVVPVDYPFPMVLPPNFRIQLPCFYYQT